VRAEQQQRVSGLTGTRDMRVPEYIANTFVYLFDWAFRVNGRNPEVVPLVGTW
jgi:hypothetical protein